MIDLLLKMDSSEHKTGTNTFDFDSSEWFGPFATTTSPPSLPSPLNAISQKEQWKGNATSFPFPVSLKKATKCIQW